MTSIDLIAFNTDIPALYENTVISPEDSGFDLFCVKDEIVGASVRGHVIKLGVGAAMSNQTGERMAYMLLPRSSTQKKGIRLANSVGIIDRGYNNEICAVVDHIGINPLRISKGDRLFQLVQFSGMPYLQYNFVDKLPDSIRNMGGFGSTGQSEVITNVAVEPVTEAIVEPVTEVIDEPELCPCCEPESIVEEPLPPVVDEYVPDAGFLENAANQLDDDSM
jgi:dUTP pyrophosphatase